MSQFQKLIYSIAKGIKDDNFIQCIRSLCSNVNVDKQSLMCKLQQIYNNLSATENARDLVTEIKVSTYLANIRGVKKLILSEKPDILLELYDFKLAIEVKRFRFRPKDESDDKNLRVYTGELKNYGDPENVQIQVEEVIKKKMESYEGNAPYYLYLWSDSSHQVEDCEIIAAINFLKKSPPKGFYRLKGIFFKWAGCHKNFKPIETNQVNNQLIKILIESGWTLQ